MTGNQVVSTMFDFSTCNHMARFVLSGDGIEDPGSHLFDPGCDGICMICMTHRSTLYVTWLCHPNLSLLA
jgi:hypothetical protein